jgi:hypothetical protein
VSNGATVGAGGYIIDYIPAGTEVIGASIVQPTGTGGYTDVAPDLPTPMDNGWGAFARKKMYTAGWTTSDAATLAACTKLQLRRS